MYNNNQQEESLFSFEENTSQAKWIRSFRVLKLPPPSSRPSSPAVPLLVALLLLLPLPVVLTTGVFPLCQIFITIPPSTFCSPQIEAYDEIINGSLKTFAELSAKIGGEVAQAGEIFKNGFVAQKAFLSVVATSKNPNNQAVLVKTKFFF